jgi:hypothetical protein
MKPWVPYSPLPGTRRAAIAAARTSAFKRGLSNMGDRGRHSDQELMVTPVATVMLTERHKPPVDLNDEEAVVWNSVIESEPADWFTVSTKPLLEQYCRHTVHCRRIAELLKRATSAKRFDEDHYANLLHMQQKETRMLIMLATTMRITQQSLLNHSGKKRMTLTRKPWED